MKAGRFACSIVALLSVSVEARAGPVVYTDLAAFQAAAGDVHEIDFETLPDGTPSYSGALITPEVNYGAEGVNFFSHEPHVQIIGNAIGGFGLLGGSGGSEGPRNWLIAELFAPALAVGVIYPGTSYLALYSPNGSFLNEWVFGGSGIQFLGVVSDVSIGTVVIDRRDNHASIESFFYTPVPEPGSLVLLLAGMLALARQPRSHVTARSKRHCLLAGALGVIALFALPGRSPAQIVAGGPPLLDETAINLRSDAGRWRINTWTETKTADPPVLPYIWVACSTRGTVVRAL